MNAIHQSKSTRTFLLAQKSPSQHLRDGTTEEDGTNRASDWIPPQSLVFEDMKLNFLFAKTTLPLRDHLVTYHPEVICFLACLGFGKVVEPEAVIAATSSKQDLTSPPVTDMTEITRH